MENIILDSMFAKTSMWTPTISSASSPAASDDFGFQFVRSRGGIGNGVGSQGQIQKSETYSRKVFLGGLPPDIDAEEIKVSLSRFGPMGIDWPSKESNTYMFPPKGFAFLIFEDEISVHRLLDGCWRSQGCYYYPMSSPSIKNKLVEIRPWKLSDSVTVTDKNFYLKQQYPAFVGGVPRGVTSEELAQSVSQKFGNVGYTVIQMDSKTDYPRGAGVVLFSSLGSYVAAILQRQVRINFSHHKSKLVEFKPFKKPSAQGFQVQPELLTYLKYTDDDISKSFGDVDQY